MRNLKVLLFVCLGIFCFQGSASASNSVEILPVTLSELLTVSTSEELDDLLYPSGVELPTKYMDFYMFAEPDVQSVELSTYAYDLLAEQFPSETGKYTWAECITVELYSWLCAQMYSDVRAGSTSEDLTAMRDVFSTGGYTFAGTTSTGRLTNLKVLQQLLQEYKSYLGSSSAPTRIEQKAKSLDPNTKTVLTLGHSILEVCQNYDEPTGLILQDRMNWVETRHAYNALLGIIIQPGGPLLHDYAGTAEYAAVTEGVGYVESFDTIYAENLVTERYAGFSGIITTVSLVVIFTSLLIYGVLDHIRKRNDPLRKWRWP